MGQYVIYLRKSRADLEAEALGEMETLAKHEKILLELAKKKKLNITKIHKEIVSGETISSRPVMQELLQEVEQNIWDGVLVMEIERLARGDTIDQGIVAQTFKYSATKIITPMKVYDPNNEFDEEYFEFGLFMSRREYKTINRRLQTGRLAAVKEGKYLGNKPPYGYVRKKLEKDKGYTLKPHPDQSKIVKIIYGLYTGENRIGVSLIAKRLNELKVPTIKGGPWSSSTIREILSNPVYIGKIRWNGRPSKKKMVNGGVVKQRPRAKKEDVVIVDGLHKPIIEKETFELAQEYLSKNPSLPVPTRYKTKNPLAGLVKCGKCGRNMNRRPYKSGNPSLMCPEPTCSNVSSSLYLVEEKILKSLEEWLYNYKIKTNLEEDNNKKQDVEEKVIEEAINKLSNELKTLEKQSNNLYDLLEQGIYTTDIFLERSKIIANKIESTKKDKKQLEENLKEFYNREKNRKVIIPKVEKVLDLYYTLDEPAEKNSLLKEVLNKVVYTKEKGGRWSGKEDSFKLQIFPKINQ